MNRQLPFDKITFKDTGAISNAGSRSISLDNAGIGKQGNMANVICVGNSDFYAYGENKNEPIDRAYANGSILDPVVRLHGKSFSLMFLAMGTMSELNRITVDLQSFLCSHKCDITTSIGTLKGCEVVRVTVSGADTLATSKRYIREFTFDFVSESAFFT